MSPRERTPEERERARLEREARRAAREGRPPPAELPPDEVPPPPVEDDSLRSRAAARLRREPRRRPPRPAPAIPPDPRRRHPPAEPARPTGVSPGPPEPPRAAPPEPLVPEPEPPAPEPPRAAPPEPLVPEPEPPAPEPPRAAPPEPLVPEPPAPEPPARIDPPAEPIDEALPLEEEPESHPEEASPLDEEPEPLAEEPAPLAHEAAPLDEEPEPLAEEPAPLAHEAAPLDEEPETLAYEPEPVAEEPDPLDHDPEPLDHDPEALDHDPEALDHDPEALDHEPDPLDYDPESSYDHDPLDHEPYPLDHEPDALDPDPLDHEPEPPPARPRRPIPPPPFEGRPAAAPGRSSVLTGRAAAARSATARELLERRKQVAARAQPGPRGRRRLVPLAVLGVLALVAVWFLLALFQPFGGEGEGQVRVVVPEGASVGQIAEVLEQKGVISSAFFFKARATVSGRREDLKAGPFQLRRDMSHAAALDALSQGPPADVLRVTIPEGRARREVQGVVEEQLKGDYLAETRSSRLLDPRNYGAKGARSLEGFLFPATYELKRGSSMQDLVGEQLRAFKREMAKVDLSAAKRRGLTAYDVLTIASMVDREAQIPRERPIIASVIYNRLRRGEPLGIDATIRFATNNWTRPLRESQLRLDSPYNTRTRQGLPPGPIGSPGLSAIRAAANPARTDFLFYVVKPGTCGEHAFSKTAAEFDADVERYNSERNRRGGRSPTNC